jgi:tripartite-type tricarboxylate transporter receptor subunit TctC
MIMVTSDKNPSNNISDFFKYAQDPTRKASFGTSAVGSPMHLAMESIKHTSKLDVPVVAYRGTAAAINDLLGGQTQTMFPGLAAALQYINAGKVRALAVTGPKRSPVLKDVPTMEELGFKGFDAMQWYGSVGPAGMPADIVKRLNETQVATLKLPEMREKLAIEAVEPMPMTPEQFGQFIKNENKRWTALAKARNIQLEE